MKIICVEPIGINNAHAENLKQNFAIQGHQFVFYSDRKEDENILIDRLKDADVGIISNIPLTKNVLSRCTNLKFLAVAFTGLDHIAMDYCEAHGIEVKNAGGYATTSVAELVVGLILDLQRKITEMNVLTREHQMRGTFLGKELKGKIVGIIGTGQIGLETAKLLLAFGCKILAYSRTQKENAQKLGIEYMSLENLIQKSDIISLHLPLTPEATHIINKQNISLCKPSALIINTARGKVIDTDALIWALEHNVISGAGIDVYDSEPPVYDDKLLHCPNCIFTPHIAFATQESFAKRIEIVFNKINEWLATKK
ncbi:MAG: hydroxyacid dehydrogenase [Bacteroidales bacterium]|nr:hydroxyacid dehydrogenase [Bacteroidales bacterium]